MNFKPLTKLNPGEKAYIVDLKNGKVGEYLLKAGIFPGDLIEIQYITPAKNYVVFKVNNEHIKMHMNAAETVLTHFVQHQFCLN